MRLTSAQNDEQRRLLSTLNNSVSLPRYIAYHVEVRSAIAVVALPQRNAIAFLGVEDLLQAQLEPLDTCQG
jgi:hypothetical protein